LIENVRVDDLDSIVLYLYHYIKTRFSNKDTLKSIINKRFGLPEGFKSFADEDIDKYYDLLPDIVINSFMIYSRLNDKIKDSDSTDRFKKQYNYWKDNQNFSNFFNITEWPAEVEFFNTAFNIIKKNYWFILLLFYNSKTNQINAWIPQSNTLNKFYKNNNIFRGLLSPSKNLLKLMKVYKNPLGIGTSAYVLKSNQPEYIPNEPFDSRAIYTNIDKLLLKTSAIHWPLKNQQENVPLGTFALYSPISNAFSSLGKGELKIHGMIRKILEEVIEPFCTLYYNHLLYNEEKFKSKIFQDISISIDKNAYDNFLPTKLLKNLFKEEELLGLSYCNIKQFDQMEKSFTNFDYLKNIFEECFAYINYTPYKRNSCIEFDRYNDISSFYDSLKIRVKEKKNDFYKCLYGLDKLFDNVIENNLNCIDIDNIKIIYLQQNKETAKAEQYFGKLCNMINFETIDNNTLKRLNEFLYKSKLYYDKDETIKEEIKLLIDESNKLKKLTILKSEAIDKWNDQYNYKYSPKNDNEKMYKILNKDEIVEYDISLNNFIDYQLLNRDIFNVDNNILFFIVMKDDNNKYVLNKYIKSDNMVIELGFFKQLNNILTRFLKSDNKIDYLFLEKDEYTDQFNFNKFKINRNQSNVSNYSSIFIERINDNDKNILIAIIQESEKSRILKFKEDKVAQLSFKGTESADLKKQFDYINELGYDCSGLYLYSLNKNCINFLFKYINIDALDNKIQENELENELIELIFKPESTEKEMRISFPKANLEFNLFSVYKSIKERGKFIKDRREFINDYFKVPLEIWHYRNNYTKDIFLRTLTNECYIPDFSRKNEILENIDKRLKQYQEKMKDIENDFEVFFKTDYKYFINDLKKLIDPENQERPLWVQRLKINPIPSIDIKTITDDLKAYYVNIHNMNIVTAIKPIDLKINKIVPHYIEILIRILINFYLSKCDSYNFDINLKISEHGDLILFDIESPNNVCEIHFKKNNKKSCMNILQYISEELQKEDNNYIHYYGLYLAFEIIHYYKGDIVIYDFNNKQIKYKFYLVKQNK
jgi:hypothetical protein